MVLRQTRPKRAVNVGRQEAKDSCLAQNQIHGSILCSTVEGRLAVALQDFRQNSSPPVLLLEVLQWERD